MDKVQEAIHEWHTQEAQLKYLNARYKILREEMDAIEKEKREIQSNNCKYTDIAIAEHKYWANEERTRIVKVIGKKPDYIGIEFVLSEKGKKDQVYYSSSLGILYHGDNPITEEEYDSLYNNM